MTITAADMALVQAFLDTVGRRLEAQARARKAPRLRRAVRRFILNPVSDLLDLVTPARVLRREREFYQLAVRVLTEFGILPSRTGTVTR